MLAEGQGSFFVAATLRGPGGDEGTVFGYQGHPSWLFVTLHAPIPDLGRLRAQLVTRDGRYVPLGEAALGGDGTWGRGIPVDLATVGGLRFLDRNGRPVLVATFRPQDPWNAG